ncbi:hypothetical protein BABINDRAFT_159269 [Babjeviella inositovora NRRL Y-12698]|uniref:Importin N-terminal domain-containing protein n=1 Tax=Babjeviella inositovora NRRL Y-12698 TaxID=984486 RepID=A0A1E3QYX6_9ASCO|nr:uncharacterized protein BABINDRAFT_159269 [Babjeviella inositovora NRRL Y-12698]ODQ82754.1 hypothetical protein BABINDRAFT_159269 [Babjeviella inositovora NRRL Y-12698]
MESTLLQIIGHQTSADNELRQQAEQALQGLTRLDPSATALALSQLAADHALPVHVRQAALLHLKQLVPQYWSLGFESFVGPPVAQDAKQRIRAALLASTADTDSKIRSGAAYAIVQVAVVDYPDEWPELLDALYAQVAARADPRAMLGAVTVLHDLFDDLVTEEQFFEGGVGAAVIQHTMELLTSDTAVEIKVQVAKLYKVALRQLTGGDAQATPERKRAVELHVPQIVQLANVLIASTDADTHDLLLRAELYKILYIVVNNFKRLYPADGLVHSQQFTLRDLAELAGPYVRAVVLADGHADVSALASVVCEAIQFIGSIHHLHFSPENIPVLYDVLIQLSLYPNEAQVRYEADVNEFVTDRAGLSARFDLRDAINEYVSELNAADAAQMFHIALANPAPAVAHVPVWMVQEANLFVLEGLFANEDADLAHELVPLATLYDGIAGHLDAGFHPLVTSAAIAALPRFLHKFAPQLGVASFATKALATVLARAEVGDELVQAAAIVSLNAFALVLEDDGAVLPASAQAPIVRIITGLLEDAEDDTNGVLLEALTLAIAADARAAKPEVMDLIFAIAQRDPGNVQVMIDAKESLEALLEQVSGDVATYVAYCERGLPGLVQAVNHALTDSGDASRLVGSDPTLDEIPYTPTLSLNLELLGQFIAHAPADGVPASVFEYVFPVLTHILLRPLDDQILQVAAEAFIAFLENATALVQASEMDVVLRIVERFLSPEMSDSAAMDAGSLVVVLVEKYSAHLGPYLQQVLAAAARRLVCARELVTIENLVTVFCHLVLMSPKEAIDFLSTFTEDGRNGLELILPIWFLAFEVTRGYAKIRQNVLALGKIYALHDERVVQLQVNGEILPYSGDLIITRSMAAAMPTQYTRVSAAFKILTLLLGELAFQSQQPDPLDYAEEDGDDWEDVDEGVPNLEKLKEYAEDEGRESDGSLKEVLVQFFRECAATDLGGFSAWYAQFGDKEKKVLAEELF